MKTITTARDRESVQMADVPPIPDSNGDIGDDDTGTPRWVYVLGIIAMVLVLMFVIMHLTVGGLGGHLQQP
jgi:hypothetical protein